MPELFLTPASISYLNQFLLALLITIYLWGRAFSRQHRPPSRQDNLLLLFFASVTLFSLLLFLEVSFLPTERLYVVYLENTVLGLLLAALIQFAYHFPAPREKQTTERRIALVLSLAYALGEAGFAVWRFSLLQNGEVEFRHNLMDVPVAFEFLWVVFVFARSSIQNWNLRASRTFALTFIIPFWLASLNIIRSYYAISTPAYHINMSVGILFTIFLFALNYLTSQPEKTSFVTKLSGAVLTGVMAVFGIVAWLVAPAYAVRYSPAVRDHRTIRFVPNARGGYDVGEIPFRFEEEFGQNLELLDVPGEEDRSLYKTDFDFPFFGHPYKTIFISNDGAIGLGSGFTWKEYQYHFTRVPMIFPLLVDLNPALSPNDGVFLRKDADRIVVTYSKVPAYNHPEALYTFQVVLFPGGSFDFTYNGLPDMEFYVDDRPEATAWAIGVKPARAPQGSVDFSNLPLRSGPEGLLQDEYRSFRIYLHNFLLPLALVVLVSSLLFLIGLPLVLNFSFARPLNSLLKGVQTFESGQRRVTIPVQFNDEIGYLTESFNHLNAELNSLIACLESRVASRTSELRESEERYRQLFDLESDAIFIIRNSDGQILGANEAASDLYGFSREELLARRDTDLSAEPEATREATNSPAPPDQVVKFPLCWHRKKTGAIFPVSITARFIAWKGESVHLTAVRDVTEQYRIEQELVQLAITDALTELPNRRHFLSQAEQVFARSNQPPFGLALLMLDMDYFKKVNDQYGHAAGDAVLREVARILGGNLRPTDLLARVGGEEFAALLPRTPRPEARLIAERLCQTMAGTPLYVGEAEIRLTISIGVALLDETVASLDELLSRADQALYDAKEAGRNCCKTWGE